MKQLKLYIQAGHDAYRANEHTPPIDAGACCVFQGRTYCECDIAAEVVELSEKYLEAAGVVVVGDLQSDDLQAVVNECNNSGADIFISVHCNAYSNGAPNGAETLVYSYYDDNGNITNAALLAENIQEQLIESLDLTDRGVKERPRLYVLNSTNCPAVLVELAFMSNGHDMQLLIDEKENFARAIARGVTDYARQVLK